MTGGTEYFNQLMKRYLEKEIAIANGKVVITVETKHGIERSVEEDVWGNRYSLYFMTRVLL